MKKAIKAIINLFTEKPAKANVSSIPENNLYDFDLKNPSKTAKKLYDLLRLEDSERHLKKNLQSLHNAINNYARTDMSIIVYNLSCGRSSIFVNQKYIEQIGQIAVKSLEEDLTRVQKEISELTK